MQMLLVAIPYVALFYLNANWLMPAYLFRRKRIGIYIGLVLLALLVVVAMCGWMLFLTGPRGLALTSFYSFPSHRIFPGIFMLMVSASYSAIRENARLEREKKEKETAHLRTELSFLRSQVNPHFMLNVLNSMALLARRKSDALEPALMELAGLMRYMLYDADSGTISLEDEVGYLKAYIDLQMLRFGGDVFLQFNTPDDTENYYLEPMLLIPLVENAFKHGIGLVENPEIAIDIRIAEENRLILMVKNKYNRSISQQDGKTGIGLKNLTKRLELIYPGQFELLREDNYRLDVDGLECWFIVTLNIPLQ